MGKLIDIIKSDLPPELPVKDGGEPTEAQKAMVLREAVSYYIRGSLRAPDVREICEDFIAAIDEAARDSVAPPLPDVPGVSITPTSGTVAATGGTGNIAVAITEPGESGTWTVEKEATATWLMYTPLAPQSADGEVNWTADPNMGAARVGHFYINGKTFTLNQDAGEPPEAVVSLSPDVAPALASGGAGSVAVTITTPGTWVVDEDPLAPWLTYTPLTPQSTDGTIDWTAGVNATGEARQATLHVNGETFTLNQGAV